MPDYVSFIVHITEPNGQVKNYNNENTYDQAYMSAEYTIEIQYTSNLPYLTGSTSGFITTTDNKILKAQATDFS